MIFGAKRFFRISCFILSICFGFISQSHADDILIVSDQQNNYSLAPHLSILEDPNNKLTIDDIRNAKYAQRFRKNSSDNLSLGYSASTYWLRLNVKNISTNDKTWLIYNNYANTHFMDVYTQANSFKHQRSGSLVPTSDREIPQREVVFSAKLPKNQEQVIYMRLQTQGNISLNINLLDRQTFNQNSASTQLVLGLFYGILLIVLIYNLFFFIVLKEISYLYLSLFMFFCGASFALIDGYLQLLLNPNQLPASTFLITMFFGAAAMALISHNKAFLLLDKKLTYIKKTHDMLLFAWLFVATLSPFTNLVMIYKATSILAVITTLYLISTSIIGWRENKLTARFAIIGWIIFSACIILVMLARLQVIPDFFIFKHLLRISLVILVILLSIALLVRINKLRVSNEKSRDILMHSELQRDLALEAGQLGIWRWQVASDKIYWTNRTCDIFGVNQTSVPKSFEEYSRYIHPDDLEYLEKTVEHAIAEHQSYSLQHRIIRNDGSKAWLQCYGKVEFDENDNLIGTIGTIQDITQQKQLETEKQQTQQLYENVFSSATEGFVIRNLEGKTIEANPAIYQMYGYSKDEFLALNLEQLIPDDSKENLQERKKVIQSKQMYFNEVKRICKDGRIIDVEVHASLIDYQGNPHVFSIVHDITERKQNETIIKSIAEGVSSTTGKAFFHQLVLQMAKLFHAHYAFISLIDEKKPVLLKTFVLCVDNKIVDNISYAFEDTPCGEVLDHETCAYPSDVQKIFPLDKLLVDMNAESYIGTPLFDTNGKPIGVIVIMDTKPMENIEYIKEIMQIFAARTGAELERVRAQSELKAHQNNLEAAVKSRTKELEAVNHELESFSYSVSHDLRSPLRAIDGFSKALMDDYENEFDAEGHDLLIRVRKNTIRMGKLIDDLLNLSRLGRADLNTESLNLGEIANEIINNLREADPSREVEFKCTVTDLVLADTEQIRIVLDNLLNNAWKYTSKKDIAVIEFGKKFENDTSIYFVKDDGAGFDMAYSGKLFGAFQRLHGREYEGSGIGLATVQRIIHRHHGSIWAEAKLNQGATFYFTLGNQEEIEDSEQNR